MGGGKQEAKGGGNREKLTNISQHFVIFCNRNGTKERKPLWKGVEKGSKRYGKWDITPPTK